MEGEKKALALTSYFVSLPPAKQSVALIIFFGLFFGLLFSLAQYKTDFYSVINFAGAGVFALSVPALLCASIFFLLRRHAYFRRLAFLSLISLVLYGIFYLISAAVRPSHSQLSASILIVGYGLVFILWFLTSKFAFGLPRAAFAFAILQLLLNALFALSANQISLGVDPISSLLKFYFASFVFLIAAYLLFFILNAPMKRNLGLSSMDTLSMFLSQWFYGGRDLEGAFEEIGEGISTFVHVAGWKTKNGKCLFVVPYVHFGPFGNLGGSQLTSQIQKALSHEGEIFVFHPTVTHDFNPVSNEEAQKAVSAAVSAASSLHFTNAKGFVCSSRANTVRARCLYANNSAFLSYTRAPHTTEDVDFSIGLALAQSAQAHCKSAIIVDEHNAETGDVNTVGSGNPISFEMLQATESLFEKTPLPSALSIGWSSSSFSSPTVGSNGIKAASIKHAKGIYSIMLFDSNGIVPSFREQLIRELEACAKASGFGASVEIFTTDTHEINTVKGVLNPLGKANRQEILSECKKLLLSSLKNMQPASFAHSKEDFSLKVLGAKQSVEIISTLNSIVAIARIAAPLVLLGATGALLWALTKF
ncbi:Uncharacterised protein [Candidatus Anstonella stagnisolia]|nr:Uncharacterised protein [Candidatus Anstonella stagnisolia]